MTVEGKQCRELLLNVGSNFHISHCILQGAYKFFCHHSFRLGLLHSRKWKALAAFALYRELRVQKSPKTLKEMTRMFEGVKTKDIHRMEQHICPDLCHGSPPSQYLDAAPYLLGLSGGEKMRVGRQADEKFKKIRLQRQMHPKSILGICLYDFLKREKRVNTSIKKIAEVLNVSASCLKRNKSKVLNTPPLSYDEGRTG